MDASEVPPAAPAVERDVRCRGCDYNLRGLASDGRCPECGAAIAESLRSDLLRFADAPWLRRVRIGVRLLQFGLLAFAAMFFVWFVPIAFLIRPWVLHALHCLTLLAPALLSAGMLTYNRRDPSGFDEHPQARLRRWIWAGAIVGLIALALASTQHVVGIFPVLKSGMVIHWPLTLLHLAGCAATLFSLGRLARRLPSERLARQLRHLGRAVAFACCAALLSTLLLLLPSDGQPFSHALGAAAAATLLAAFLASAIELFRLERRLRAVERDAAAARAA